MKSIKKQVIDAYDKHYVSSCAEVVDLTLEKVEEMIIDLFKKYFFTKRGKYNLWCYNGIDSNKYDKLVEELKLSLKGGKK